MKLLEEKKPANPDNGEVGFEHPAAVALISSPEVLGG